MGAVSEYFIRLDTLLGAHFLQKAPVLQYLGVRSWRETWNGEASVVTAEAVLEAALEGDIGGLHFSFGAAQAGETVFRIEIASDRSSIVTGLADRAEEMAGVTDNPPRPGLQIFARADGPSIPTRVQIHDIGLRIRLPEKWAKKGVIKNDRLVLDTDHPGPVEIVFASGTVVIDVGAEGGFFDMFSFVPDDGAAITVDPIFIPGPDIGIEIQKLKLDMSTTEGIPEVLARPGYQETWKGLYLEEFKLWGLDSAFPTLPPKLDPKTPPPGVTVELSKVVIDFSNAALSGSIKVQINEPDRTRVLQGGGLTLDIDRGVLVRAEVDFFLDVGKAAGETESNSSIGPDGLLQVVAAGRFNPDGRIGWEVALKTPGTADRGLITLTSTATTAIMMFIASWQLIDEFNDGHIAGGVALSVLLGVLFWGNHQRFFDSGKEWTWFDFKRLTLDAVTFRTREELVAGRHLKWLDVMLDLQLQIQLKMMFSKTPLFGGVLSKILPDIETDPDHPLGLTMRGLRFSVAWNFGDFTEAELAGRGRFDLDFPNEYQFDLGDQSIIKSSPVVLAKFGFGQWDQGSWIDLGLKYAKNEPSGAYSVMPAVVRLFFLSSGEYSHFTFDGMSFSVLVPGVLYVRGALNLGDPVTEASLQGWFVSSPGLAMKEYDKRENWHWDVGAQYRKAPLPSGGQASIVFAWLKTSSGIPVPLLPCVALYGGHFLYAENMRPALSGDTIDRWFTEHEPKNQIDISKWEGNADSTGVGFGLVLGAQADRGRPWNAQLGLLYADSQWLLSGYLNFLKQRPDPADTSKGSFLVLGAWGNHRLALSARLNYNLPADGKVLKVDAGVDVLVDRAQDESHLYVGFHWPPDRHVRATVFGRYEAGAYLIEDAKDVGNFAGQGITLPGHAVAMGARFAIEGGYKGSHFKLYLYLNAAGDLAFAGSNPFITVLHAKVAGGVVAKAYGIGFELEAAAEFLWVRPTPHMLVAKIKITLDLPWPLPDFDYTFDNSDGADGDTEALQTLVEGLTLVPRMPNGVVELAGDAAQPLVPLDPTFLLSFSYPTRNGTAVAGNFQITALGLNAVDTTVTHETSPPHAYAIELTALRLWRGTPGSGVLHPGPVPAKWVKQQTPAAGGQPSRRVLELFSLEDVAVARLVGPSAMLVDDLGGGWSPCPPSSPTRSLCYLWIDEPPGPIAGTETIALADAPSLTVRVLGEPEGAESMRRYFGWTAQDAAVVPFTLLSGVPRALRIPAVVGGALPDEPAAPQLELRFALAHNALLQMVRPGRDRRVTVRFYRGDRLVKEDAEGTVLPGLEGKWQHVVYTCDLPVDRAVIEAELRATPDASEVAAFLLRACVVLESDHRHHQDAVDSAAAWNAFWTTVGSPDPLVLAPATHYTLEVEGTWSRIVDGNETPGGTLTKTFEFDTVGLDQWPTRLRGADESLDGKAGYDLRTVPASGAVSVYPDRAIRLELRNRRIDELYAAFGRRLALRLGDDRGGVDVRWLDATPEPPSDLPDSELAWLGVVQGAACTPGGVDVHWHFPVVRITNALATSRRYEAATFALETTADLATVDWASQAPAHRFTFNTSRWPTFAAHVAAYGATGALDELVPSPTFTAVAAAVGAAARVLDDALLATVMTDLFGLPPRPPAAEPELVRVWGRDATGERLVALLLDGPEPLPRPGDGALELRTAANAALPIALVQTTSGARTLILFRDGATSFGPLASQPLTLVASDAFVAADGSRQTDFATIALPVPARPAFLEPEGPP